MHYIVSIGIVLKTKQKSKLINDLFLLDPSDNKLIDMGVVLLFIVVVLCTTSCVIACLIKCHKTTPDNIELLSKKDQYEHPYAGKDRLVEHQESYVYENITNQWH